MKQQTLQFQVLGEETVTRHVAVRAMLVSGSGFRRQSFWSTDCQEQNYISFLILSVVSFLFLTMCIYLYVCLCRGFVYLISDTREGTGAVDSGELLELSVEN